MDPAAIFIILLIVGAIIIVIIFAIRLRQITQAELEGLRGQPLVTSSPDQQQREITGWSTPTGVPGERGMCSLYTFPAQGPNRPAIPTTNTAVVDQLAPGSVGNVDCFDIDQLALQKVVQVCLGGGVFGNICYDNRGRKFAAGQGNQFYTFCNKTQCQDTLAPVALNFQPNNLVSKTACLQFDPINNTNPVVGQQCNLTSASQILRIERQNPNGSFNNAGVFGRLFDRNSGLCIVPSSPNPTADDTLVLGQCAPSSGYVWWFFPPQSIPTEVTVTLISPTDVRIQIESQGIDITVDPDDPSSTGLPFPILISRPDPPGIFSVMFITDVSGNLFLVIAIPSDIVISDEPMTTTVNTVAPQQLVYFPNQGSRPPQGDDLTDFLMNSNPVAMAAPVDEDGDTIYGQPITMQPMATIATRQEEYTAQTLDYWLYKTITTTPITCRECGTNFIF